MCPGAPFKSATAFSRRSASSHVTGSTNDLGIIYQPRPYNGWLRQIFGEFETSVVTDLHNRWESCQVFMAPINWRLESGDRVEFNVIPRGEYLTAPFEIEGSPFDPAPANGSGPLSR